VIDGPTPAREAGAGPRVKIVDVMTRAQRWEELCASAGESVRSLDGDELVLHPLTIHDEHILALCNDAWTDSILVVAHVLAMQSTTDAFLRWRIRELLREGRLQARGPKNRLDLPSEVRVAV
jgi:hypothetical protein